MRSASKERRWYETQDRYPPATKMTDEGGRGQGGSDSISVFVPPSLVSFLGLGGDDDDDDDFRTVLPYSLRSDVGDGSRIEWSELGRRPPPLPRGRKGGAVATLASARGMERRALRPNGSHLNVGYWSDANSKRHMEDR